MRGGVGCSAFRRSQILSCWRHHALRAPIMGCSPPSRHSYRPRTIRSTVAAPMAMARFRPPPRARFPRSTYAVVVRVFRALRLRTSSYPVCGASLFLFSLLWLSGLLSFSGPHPSLSLVELLAPVQDHVYIDWCNLNNYVTANSRRPQHTLDQARLVSSLALSRLCPLA